MSQADELYAMLKERAEQLLKDSAQGSITTMPRAMDEAIKQLPRVYEAYVQALRRPLSKGDPTMSAADQLIEMAKGLVAKATPALSFADAMEIIARDHPDLYAEYTRQSTLRAHGGRPMAITKAATAEEREGVLDEINRRVSAMLNANPGMLREDAVMRIFQEDNALYERYRQTSMV